jgi:hypothetical protein
VLVALNIKNEAVERLVHITQRAPQHWHAYTGDHLHAHAVGQPQRHVAWRGAEHIGQDQRLRSVHARQQRRGLCFDLLDGHVGWNVECGQRSGTVWVDMFGYRTQRRSERGMGNYEQASHV